MASPPRQSGCERFDLGLKPRRHDEAASRPCPTMDASASIRPDGIFGSDSPGRTSFRPRAGSSRCMRREAGSCQDADGGRTPEGSGRVESRTLRPSRKITLEPRKPIPETTCAAIRGLASPGTRAARITKVADPKATSVFVRRPAMRLRHWRSKPMTALRPPATARLSAVCSIGIVIDPCLPQLDFGQNLNGLAIDQAQNRVHQFLYGHGQAETARKIAVVSTYPANALSPALSKLPQMAELRGPARFCQQSVLLGEPHQGLSHANDGARLDAGAQRKATRREYEDG